MKNITINGKEYTFEFSIAASLFNECTEEIMNAFVNGGMIQDAAKSNNIDGALNRFVASVSNIPQRTITLFYAALLEHHGAEYGDGSVGNRKDATKLLAAYLKEHKEDNDGKGMSFYDVMNEMMELIVADNFFEMIGLEKMLNSITETEPKKKRKKAGAE